MVPFSIKPAALNARKRVPREKSFVVKSGSCLGHVNDSANGNHENIPVNALGGQLARWTYAQFCYGLGTQGRASTSPFAHEPGNEEWMLRQLRSWCFPLVIPLP